MFSRRRPARLPVLIGIGVLSAAVYLAALLNHDFYRPGMVWFLALFGLAWVLYTLAIGEIMRGGAGTRRGLLVIFAFAALFQGLLALTWPKLSDDMFRYVWDGRVQAAGINPYRYPSDAPELAALRDETIWPEMNRPTANTIYPPGAQAVFALTWRIFPDSVVGFKAVMIGFTLAAGGLLVLLIRAWGGDPALVLIFLWNPLTTFEIGHAGHVDALYLPFVVAALYARLQAPPDRVSWRHEALIGVLLGIGTLLKLYPAFLAAPLWSVRLVGGPHDGRRRWRFAMPISMLITIALGYGLYLAPGVNLLGFFSQYQREFFNVAPLPIGIIQLGQRFRIPWHTSVNTLMPALIVVISLLFWAFPAKSARGAISRCAWPIGIYLIINQNVFSWYVLFMLPLVAVQWGGWRLTYAFAWWAFSGLIALSYTFFLQWKHINWVVWLQYVPLYTLLTLAFAVPKLDWLRVRLLRRIRP